MSDGVAICLLCAVSASSTVAVAAGPDGDPPAAPLPPAPSEDPVQRALEQLPLCAGELAEGAPTLEGVFAEIPVSAIIAAIEEGDVLRPFVRNAINAAVVLGSPEDRAYLLDHSDDLAWSYVADVAEPGASALAVHQAHAKIAGDIRTQVLDAWWGRGDIPSDRVLTALHDSNFWVRSHAVMIGLKLPDASVVAEAHTACDLEAELAASHPLCGSEAN